MPAWNFLVALRSGHDCLQPFFDLERDFLVGLVSYNMLLSLLELASDARDLLARDSYVDIFDVPPMFPAATTDIQRLASRKVNENSAVVQKILQGAGAAADDVRAYWPKWKESIIRVHLRNPESWRGDVTIRDLAGL